MRDVCASGKTSGSPVHPSRSRGYPQHASGIQRSRHCVATLFVFSVCPRWYEVPDCGSSSSTHHHTAAQLGRSCHMSHLVGKNVVVTGGSRGIGRGLVQKLLDRDNHVVATTRSVKEATALQQLAQQHPKLTITELDTSQETSISSWAAHVKQLLPHVDLLINNAGVYGKRGGFADFRQQDFLEVYATNAVGPYLVAQQLHQQGVIGPPGTLVVNITSIMASQGDPTVSSVTGGGYAYRASKAALNIINKAMAMDLAGDDIRCVLVHPGYVQTDMTGGQGWVTVEESTSGIMKLLTERQPADLNGKFFAFSGDEIPW